LAGLLVLGGVLIGYLLYSLNSVKGMDGKTKTKTSITIDEELWMRFKAKAAEERGLKGVSEAVEESLREELGEEIVVEALEEMTSTGPGKLDVEPVETRVETSSGMVIREMREQTP
jgi:Arc/MetJ family transcription regulator